MRNALLLACAIVFGLAGIVYADAPFQRSPSGLSAASAAGTFLKLDASNSPITGDLSIGQGAGIDTAITNTGGAAEDLEITATGAASAIRISAEGSATLNGATTTLAVGGASSLALNSGFTTTKVPFYPLTTANIDLGHPTLKWRDFNMTGDITLAAGAGNTSYIQNNGATAENIMIQVTGTNTQLILDAALNVQLSHAGGTKLRIDGYGNHIYGNIHPEVDKLYDLGSATTAMRTAYVETLLGPASTNLTVDTVGAGTKVGTYANGTLATLISETSITTALNTQSLTTGTSMQVGYDTGAGGCSAPVTCGVATVGTLFYCRDTGASKAGAYCGCMQDAADAYVWSELTTTIASGAVCP